MPKKSILRTKRAFQIKCKAFFIIFEGLSLKEIKKNVWKVKVQLYAYLCKKTDFGQKIEMNGIFFFDLQQDFPFLKYKSVCLFDEPYNFNIYDTIIVVL